MSTLDEYLYTFIIVHLFIITNDHGVPTKFGLRKVKRLRISGNRHV